MKENLFTKGFEKGISGEKIAATEIKKISVLGFIINILLTIMLCLGALF